jgi:predicted metal-dependent hydrolase
MHESLKADDRQHDSQGRNNRRFQAFLQRNNIKMSHREERLAAAAAKRARKNTRRIHCAIHSEMGQRLSREMVFGEPFSSIGLCEAVLVSA